VRRLFTKLIFIFVYRYQVSTTHKIISFNLRL